MISAALSRAVERTVPALPDALDVPVSTLAGTLAYLAAPRARAAVRDNLRHITGRDDLARRVFIAQARHYIETLRILGLSPERARAMIELDGWPHLTQAQARGKGVILASAHLGPVVLCGQILVAHGYDVAVLVEPKTSDLGRLIDRARSALGIRTIETRSPMGIVRALARGGIVAFLADRAITGVGERVPFFGREALLPSAHVAIALRTGAAVVPAFAVRDRGRLRAYLGPELDLARTGDHAADVRDGVRRWAGVLEEWISRAPEQWSIFERMWAS